LPNLLAWVKPETAAMPIVRTVRITSNINNGMGGARVRGNGRRVGAGGSESGRPLEAVANERDDGLN
jgi:hypothetical protein